MFKFRSFLFFCLYGFILITDSQAQMGQNQPIDQLLLKAINIFYSDKQKEQQDEVGLEDQQ